MSLELMEEDGFMNISISDDDEDEIFTNDACAIKQSFGDSNSMGSNSRPLSCSSQTTIQSFTQLIQNDIKFSNPFTNHEILNNDSTSTNANIMNTINNSGIFSGKKFILTGNIIDRDSWISNITLNGGIIFDPLNELVFGNIDTSNDLKNKSLNYASQQISQESLNQLNRRQSSSTTLIDSQSSMDTSVPLRRRKRNDNSNNKISYEQSSVSDTNQIMHENKVSFKTFGTYDEVKAHIQNKKLSESQQIANILHTESMTKSIDRNELYVINQDGRNIFTIKFLFALALKAIPVNLGWIDRCIVQSNWMNPPVPSGFTKDKIFKNHEKIMIRDASPLFKKQWEVLLREMGAIVLTDRDMDEIPTLFVIMVEAAPTYDSRRFSNHYNIPIVNVKYMKRCLILGEKIPLSQEFAYNAPEESKENTNTNNTQSENNINFNSYISKEKSSLNDIFVTKNNYSKVPHKFLGDFTKKFGNYYYKQVILNGEHFQVNQCISINVDALGSIKKHSSLSSNNNIALIRDLFKSGDDSLLRIQMFKKRYLIDETCENTNELYLSTDILDGIPLQAIEGRVKVFLKTPRLKRNILSSSNSQNSPVYFCTQEIDLGSEKVVPLKQCLWQDQHNIYILDTDPQEDESGRATFYTTISMNGLLLCENAIISIETNSADNYFGRIVEIFQTNGSSEIRISLQIGVADQQTYQISLKDDSETLSFLSSDIFEVKIIQIVNDPQYFRSKDFYGEYWKIVSSQ